MTIASGLLPLLVLAVTVSIWSVDVPFWDQWSLVDQLAQLDHGRLGLDDLWRQHNEHRLLFPKLIMLGLARLSGWDVRWEMAFTIAMAIWLAATLIFLRRSQRRLVALPRPIWLWLTLLTLIVFNLSQEQNWLWGWQLQILLCIAAQAASLSVLYQHGDRAAGLLAAGALGAVASYSFSCGLVIWPAALPILLLRPGSRLYRSLAWLACSGLIIGLYLIGIGVDPRGLGTALTSPGMVTGYTLAYLGSPLAGFAGNASLLAGAIGLIGFVLLSLWSLRASESIRQMAAVWISLGLLALGCAVMTAFGRSDIGTDQALASRYISFANLLWIAVVVLGLSWFAGRSPTRGLRLCAVTATGLLVATLLLYELIGGLTMHRSCSTRSAARDSLLATCAKGGATVQIRGPAKRLHHKREFFRERVLILRQLRMGPFR